MKITFLVNRDLPANIALNTLLPTLSRDHDLTVFLSDRVGRHGKAHGDLDTLKFFEQSLFNDVVFPLLDANDSQGELLTFQGLGQYTVAPPSTLNDINAAGGLDRLKESQPDLVVSIRYGAILRGPAIDVPAIGVINLHSGLLPAYRGVMATFRAMLANEAEIGCTLHYITDEGIDTGDIISTTRLAVTPDRSYLWHVLALYDDGCKAIADCIGLLAAGGQPAASAQPGGGSYFSFPGADELDAFRQRGLTLYDAAHITELVDRFTRGSR